MTGSNVASREWLRAALAAFPHRSLGALVSPGFHPFDLWGPLQMFGELSPAVSPVLVGSRDGPIASADGLMVVADIAMGESPRLDLLLIPGGGRSDESRAPETLDWLRWQAADAEIVMSVGDGARLLASTGLLDGRRATANSDDLPSIAADHIGVNWVSLAPWVGDGKFVTSSGGFVAIDMSLAVIARLAGERVATTVADRTGYRWVHRPGLPEDVE